MTTLTTPRLLLRRFTAADRPALARLNADPAVMEHFPAVLDAAQSNALVDRIEEGFERHGFGLWAVEARATGAFVGFTGLAVPSFTTAFTPCVEVGWRLAREAWGHGYAREAAAEAVRFGFTHAGLAEILSFTVPANVRSRRVMEALGMEHDAAGDFDHPRLPPGHPLQRHVLYRLSKERWAARHAG